jgi:hypothetical protein
MTIADEGSFVGGLTVAAIAVVAKLEKRSVAIFISVIFII